MNGSINRRELFLKALAGFAGGAIGWAPVELANRGQSLTENISWPEIVASYVTMALLSGLIGGLIVAVENQQLDLSPAAQKRFLRGFVICSVLALPADYISNMVFSSILHFGGWGLNHEGSTFYLFCARVVSWVIMGAMLGAGVGISTLSIPNVVKGAIGGWVGGFIGGVLFDPINYEIGGWVSRLVGLSAIGLAIGLFIGLVQELTKAAWITVDQGRLKGRQFRVEGARVTLGRAEENPVGLFGDPAVQQRHAAIERKGAEYTIRNLAVQEGTFVNGNRIETTALHDGDQIRIGGYQLGFHLRQGSSIGPARVSLGASSPGQAPLLAQSAAGPHLVDDSGQRFPLRVGGATRMGRALDNDIVVNHSSVSRHHASIESVNGGFELRDLQSQNGTFVKDQRVTQVRIADGDSVKLGQAPFTFRA
ncbi:MAG TPA: FHA domain-containing protein [Candidatus Binataceae bacterium]|nr:FHA domain-containing protein [Candidatus Binataceae bacterium]